MRELGISNADPEAFARGNDRELVSKQKMLQYILCVLRLEYMRQQEIDFLEYQSEYWQEIGIDRIMHIYVQL